MELGTGERTKATDAKEWGLQAGILNRWRTVNWTASSSRGGTWGLNQGLGIPIKWGTVESQLGGEPSYCQLVQRAELRTKRNLPMALGQQKGELEGFEGTMPVFLVAEVIRSFLRIPRLSPNVLEKQKPAE